MNNEPKLFVLKDKENILSFGMKPIAFLLMIFYSDTFFCKSVSASCDFPVSDTFRGKNVSVDVRVRAHAVNNSQFLRIIMGFYSQFATFVANNISHRLCGFTKDMIG